jgi:hypothetical protein
MFFYGKWFFREIATIRLSCISWVKKIVIGAVLGRCFVFSLGKYIAMSAGILMLFDKFDCVELIYLQNSKGSYTLIVDGCYEVL